MVKKIHYMLKLTLKLQESSREPIVLLAPDRILNFQQRIKSKIPILSPVKCMMKNKKGEEHSFFMNKPSQYLKHLATTPGMIDQMSALPDFTSGQWPNLNQSDKWKYHESFQVPMITFKNQDFWVGNLVKDHQNRHWLVKKFVTKTERNISENETNLRKYVECFLVIPDNNSNDIISTIFVGLTTNFAVMPNSHLVSIDTIALVTEKTLLFYGNGCTINYDANCQFTLEHDGLDEDIFHLWHESHTSNKFKRILSGSSQNNKKYMKVALVPLILWFDDTSGNKSKHYNISDSYLIYLAAMPLEMRSRQENTLFICTSDKNLIAIDMLDPIVNAFVKLEIGIEVFSYDHNEYILLVAPLLLLIADNPRHSQLAKHKDCPVEVLHTISLGCIKYLVDYFMKEVLTVAERDRLDNLYILDKHLWQTDAKPPKFSLRPKIHLLHHLLNDIQQFGCPLQYETKSAEQLNQFICEHLFMTNQLYTSWDVASRFGKQFICCQIFNSLFFVYTKSWKENGVQKESIVCDESGFEIKSLQANNVDFKKHFFSAHANVTDSYYINKSKIINGLTELFSTAYGLFLGRIITDQEDCIVLQRYVFAQANNYTSSWLPGILTDIHSNPFILPAKTILVDDFFKCKEIMEFGFVFGEDRSIIIINISKFDTY
ncbi:hypothetical protein F4703DRAFT_1954272 [Phycomyces blakesleeanus]